MRIHKKKELLYNSDLGSLPWLLFVITQSFTTQLHALALAIIVWGVCVFYYVKTKHDRVFLIRLEICGVVLLILLACLTLLPISKNYVVLLAEVSLFFALWYLYTFKAYIRKKYLRESTSKDAPDLSTSLTELFFISSVYLNALLLHFSIAFLYFILLDEYHSPEIDKLMYNILGIIFVIIVALYSYIRVFFIRMKLRTEEWLPVVNDNGVVTGKVARSVSFNIDSHYLHPTIRIALIYKGQLYLRERSAYELLNPCKYDYPFEQYVYYGQTLRQTVASALKTVSGGKKLKPRFVFKYLYEAVGTKRLVHLYTLLVHDEETMKTFKSLRGRIWTESQIEENLGKDIFPDCFEKEYEFLKNTVLMAEKLVADSK